MSGLAPDGYRGGNAVLDSLPASELAVLLPHLTVYDEEEATLTLKRGRAIAGVYFPCGAIYSVIVEMTSGEAYEVNVIGRNDAAGAELLLGAGSAPRTVLCQGRGRVAFLPDAAFKSSIVRSPALAGAINASLLRQWFVSQQTAACNIAHPATQRVARWILMTRDAVGADEFSLRFEFLKLMVAVNRAELAAAVEHFVRRGVIRYEAERVRIVSGPELRHDACDCFQLQLIEATHGAPSSP